MSGGLVRRRIEWEEYLFLVVERDLADCHGRVLAEVGPRGVDYGDGVAFASCQES